MGLLISPPFFFFSSSPLAEYTSNETPKSLQLLDKGICKEYAQRVFRLWDKNNRIAYEGFELDDVVDGDTIQVRSVGREEKREKKQNEKITCNLLSHINLTPSHHFLCVKPHRHSKPIPPFLSYTPPANEILFVPSGTPLV